MRGPDITQCVDVLLVRICMLVNTLRIRYDVQHIEVYATVKHTDNTHGP
jgi:hypothetical protein